MSRQPIPDSPRKAILSPPPSSVEVCTHERRPGTTVCLRCRHAARVAARERAKRLLLRGTAGVVVLATVVAGGVLGASSLRAKTAADTQTRTDSSVAGMVATDSTPVTTAPTTRADSGTTPAALAAATVPKVAEKPAGAPTAPFTPVVPRGESVLSDGVTMVRGDSDVVVVSFDTPMLRTRRPEKFEQFVRRTLAAIYGRPVSTALAAVPDGGIAAQGDLLTELPARGVHIPVNGNWAIHLFPETRPGQDGPLVIRYRVRVAPAGG